MNQRLRGSSAWSTRRDPVDFVAALARGARRRINGRLRIEPNHQTRGRGAQMRGRLSTKAQTSKPFSFFAAGPVGGGGVGAQLWGRVGASGLARARVGHRRVRAPTFRPDFIH